MKPLGARWLKETVSHVEGHRQLIVNGFHEAGISEVLKLLDVIL
jgi:hypothetical protein